jgi:hypothetical protein
VARDLTGTLIVVAIAGVVAVWRWIERRWLGDPIMRKRVNKGSSAFLDGDERFIDVDDVDRGPKPVAIGKRLYTDNPNDD